MTACSHPIRDGRGLADNFDVIGSHATDTWGRCKTCGTWWWTVTDDGRFQYEDQWIIPTDLADAALTRHDPDALARLFVSRNLPHGPLWDFSGALLEIFRALTPNATDDARARALEDAGAKGEWEQVIRGLKLDAQLRITVPPIAFDVDLRLGVELREHYEIGDALVLLTERPELLRLQQAGVVQLPLAAVPRVMANSKDRILVEVRADRGAGIVVLDAAGTASSWPLAGEYRVDALDEGWWLFVPDTDDERRFIELHLPDGRPRVKFPRRFVTGKHHVRSWMPRPRRFADGWIVSDLISDDGKPQALTLFDAEFRTTATSEAIDGEREVTPIDETSFWASVDDVMERWVRRGSTLDRAQHFDSRASFVVGDVLITDTRSGEVVGRGLDGRVRWQWKRATDGATYGVATVDGVLLYDNRRAHLLGSDGALRTSFAIEDADVGAGTDGTVYLKSGAELWIVRQDARAIAVGTDAELETTAGDDAVLRTSHGCLLVGKDGIRGTFEADGASFGVVGTRGLWVVGGDRVRGVFPR